MIVCFFFFLNFATVTGWFLHWWFLVSLVWRHKWNIVLVSRRDILWMKIFISLRSCRLRWMLRCSTRPFAVLQVPFCVNWIIFHALHSAVSEDGVVSTLYLSFLLEFINIPWRCHTALACQHWFPFVSANQSHSFRVCCPSIHFKSFDSTAPLASFL